MRMWPRHPATGKQEFDEIENLGLLILGQGLHAFDQFSVSHVALPYHGDSGQFSIAVQACADCQSN